MELGNVINLGLLSGNATSVEASGVLKCSGVLL